MQIEAILKIALQLTGVTLIALSLAHLVLPKMLRWSEDLKNLSPINHQIFIAHAAFIAIGILLLGIVCLVFPDTLIEHSALARIANVCFLMCWVSRLIMQFWWFRGRLVDAQGQERAMRAIGTLLWIYYVGMFGALTWYQFS